MSTLTEPKVMLDTTVLMGAALTDGINRKILEIARTPIFFIPVISNVCLLELVRNLAKGPKVKGKRREPFTIEEIDFFIEKFIFPIVGEKGPVNSVFSRDSYEIIQRCTYATTVREVLNDLTSLSNDQVEKVTQQKELDVVFGKGIPNGKYDIQDFHVWATAIQTECGLIVTSNLSDFPQQIGSIQVIPPGKFYADLIEA